MYERECGSAPEIKNSIIWVLDRNQRRANFIETLKPMVNFVHCANSWIMTSLFLHLDGPYNLILLIIAYLATNRTSLPNDNVMVFFVSAANLWTLMKVEKGWYILNFNFTGTHHYCPPEFFSHHCFFGNQATVWQLGFLLNEMLSGEMPYVKPRMALYMPPSVPKYLSKGKNVFRYRAVYGALFSNRRLSK